MIVASIPRLELLAQLNFEHNCRIPSSLIRSSQLLTLRRPSFMLFLWLISLWPLLMTPTYPRRRGMILLLSMSDASVPGSIRSSLVRTPIVLLPSGSTLPRTNVRGGEGREGGVSLECYKCAFSSLSLCSSLCSYLLAILRASEFARSVFPAVTAKIIAFGLLI